MQDNPERGELDATDDVDRHWKKNSPSFAPCIGKRTKEDCDSGSEIGRVYNEEDKEGPVPLRKPKKSGRRERERVVRKVLSSGSIADMSYLCNDQRPVNWKHGRRRVPFEFW